MVNGFSSINIAITGRCNYRCRHCFMAFDKNPIQEEMTLTQLISLLDQAQALGVNRVNLTGGEPLLRSDFVQILDAIYERDMRLEYITTNGSLITEKLLSDMRVRHQQPLTKLSFDGVGRHDWMRGVTGAEESAIRAIRLLKQMGFPVLVQMCLHAGNTDVLNETVKKMDELGVDSMRIMPTAESPRWIESAGNNSLTIRQYYEAGLKLLQWYTAASLTMRLTIWSFVSYYPDTGRFHCRPIRCPQGNTDCNAPVCRNMRREIFIAYDGSVYPCNPVSGTFTAHKIKIGNALIEGLSNVINSEIFQSYSLMTVNDLAEQNDACRVCEFFSYCLGGCRGMAFALDGSYTGRDPYSCIFFKEGYVRRVYETIKSYRKVVRHS